MWMSGSSTQLWHCTEDCTVVRIDAGPCERFEVKVASRVCIESTAVVMDVVSSEVRSGLPSELLYGG